MKKFLYTTLSILYEATHPNRIDLVMYVEDGDIFEINKVRFMNQVIGEVAKWCRLKVIDREDVMISRFGFISLKSLKGSDKVTPKFRTQKVKWWSDVD